MALRRPAASAVALTVTDLSITAALTVAAIGYFPFLLFPAYTAGLAALLVVALPGVACACAGAFRGDVASRLALAVIVWIALGALLGGAARQSMLGNAGSEVSGVVVIGAVAAWALSRQMSPVMVERLPSVLVALLGVCGAVGVMQVMVGAESGLLAPAFGRARGFMQSPVHFGAAMAGAGVLAAKVQVHLRLVLFGGVAAFGACAYLSGSRVAVVAGAGAIVAQGLTQPRSAGERRFAAAAARAGAWIGGLGVGWVVATASSARGAVDRAADTGSGGRLDAWRYGLSAVADHPLAGWGFGRFRVATQRHWSPDFVANFARDDLRQPWFDAHNLVVSVLVASGVVGLALIAGWAIASRPPTASWQLWFVAAIGATWLLQPISVATLLMAVIVWGAGRASETAASGLTEGSTDRSRPLLALLTLVGLAAGSYLVVADTRLHRAVDSGSSARIEQAATLYPGDAVVADLVAQSWYIDEETDPSVRHEVIKWSERTVEYDPERPYFWSRFGVRLSAFGDPEGAFVALDRALELEPWHLQSWIAMAVIAERYGDTERGEQAHASLCVLGMEKNLCS